ncbi:hypothetical protein KAR48_14335, partial [bacterium]|nr:hypothetical protein [bacterium]
TSLFDIRSFAVRYSLFVLKDKYPMTHKEYRIMKYDLLRYSTFRVLRFIILSLLQKINIQY